MFDTNQWQDLIICSLPFLKTFNFHFYDHHSTMNLYNVREDFKQFQTDFWQVQHQWYTEYLSSDYAEEVYTTPYMLHKYSLEGKRHKHCQKTISDRNSFENITNL